MDSLAGSDQERKIFLRALRDFSEACEPPELIAGCPFAVEVEPGLRGCAEECMDILGKHEAPAPLQRVELGNGLSAFRPRQPRARRLEKPANGFDARQVYLEAEASGPPQRWPLGPILYAIQDEGARSEMLQGDPLERERKLRLLCDLASARGLSLEDHIVPYLRDVVPMAVSLGVLYSSVRGDEPSALERAWIDACPSVVDLTSQSFSEIHFDLFKSITRWAQTASAEDLFSLAPPSSLPDPSLPPDRATPESKIGAWLFDRFTETYLDRWRSDSLRFEWKYLHGQQAPPCSSIEMKVREISESDLARIMAERFSNPRMMGHNKPPLSEAMTNQLVEPALQFIGQGRRKEAQALFEAILLHDPESAGANNNLGFCLIPDDPQQALHHLEKAAQFDEMDKELTTVNRMLALVMLGRSTSVLDLASAVFGIDGHSQIESNPTIEASSSGSFLWNPIALLQEGRAEIIQTSDLRRYAEVLTRTINTWPLPVTDGLGN
jgi:hypothetical protein